MKLTSLVIIFAEPKRTWWAVANGCFLCIEEKGTVDHILLHCENSQP